MSRADDILKKYGIQQVRNAETDPNVRVAVQKRLNELESGKSSSTTRTSSGSSKADNILKKYGIQQVRNAETDSSVRERVQSRLNELDAQNNISGRMTVGDIGPVKEEKKKWYEGYFQKGAFGDGITLESVSKAILGTGSDLMEDITTGIVGMGENVVDAFAQLAPIAYKAQVNANGGIMSVKQQQFHDELMKDAEQDIAAFVEKDLYDENKVAKKILSNVYGAANNAAKTQNGQQLTKEDIIQQKQSAKTAQKYLDETMESQSVLGEKSDSIAQSLGHRVASVALQSVGVPWWMTYGTTTFGSEAENAYKNGATYNKATMSGGISAAAEIASESLFGGSGLGETGLINLDPLTRGISNKVAKTVADYLVDVGAEGSEEVFSSVVSRLGSALYREESLKEILASEEAFDEYIQSFISGSAMSGIMNAPKVASHVAGGTDYRDNLTQNEQKVVDRVYEDRLAEREKNGKLTAREKSKLHEQVITDMEKGYISTELIEEVLGGEKYEQYRNAKDWEDSLQKEFDELGNKQNATLAEQRRYTELEQQLKNVKATSTLGQMKEQIGNDVFALAQGDRLVESYNERARRGQAFEADLTKYTKKQQQTIQNAINSGTLNNTNRTHELVDFIAKVSADKGVLFDFTNNEKIKGTQFAVEGKIVNGYVTDSGITLNVESPKYLESTVGHEITHVLEGTEFYDTLKTTIFDYAKSKGEYDTRLKNLTELYKNVKDADVEAELTADLVGDYIFTDTDFVNRLSTENRNVFQKIYDEIKYLCKVATAGSKEARELEKVKKVFEDAYRANGKQSDTKTEVEATIDPENDSDLDYESPAKYSISVTDPKTIDFLENQEHITTYKAMVLIDGKLYPPMASKVKGEDGKYHMTNPRDLGEWQQATEDTTNIKFNDKGVGYYDLKKDDGGTVRAAYNPYEHSSNLVLNDQFEAAYKRGNLVTVECVVPKSEMDNPYKAEYAKDSTGVMDWHSGVVAGKLTDNKRSVYLSRYLKAVRIMPDSEVAQKYKEIVGDTPVPFNVVSPGLLAELEKVGVNIDYQGSPQYQYQQRKAAEREAKKGVKYSLSDSSGKELSNEQAEYFKDSKVRDNKGNLMVLYHGTPHNFTVFDLSRSGENYDGWSEYGEGIYLTPDKKAAQYYADNAGLGKDTNLMELYANVKNPFNTLEAVEFDISEYVKKYELTEFDERFLKGAGYRLIDFLKTHKESVYECLSAHGYDGIWDMDSHGQVCQVVAYEENQVKNTTNQKPTKDVDIRYSLSDSDGKQLTKEQQDYFKDSKMRDEKGNLMVMYHGSENAGFHVFDSKFSDDETSFFFVDRNDVAASYSGTTETYEAKTVRTVEDMNNFLAEIGYDHYEAVEKNGKFELLENNEHVAWSDTAQGIYEEFCWYEGVGDGDANYKVYLNLKNPLEVDAHGRNWDMVGREFSQELYDKYMTLTDAEKAALVDATMWDDFGSFRDEVNDARDSVSFAERTGREVDEHARLLASAVEKVKDSEGNLDMYTLHYFATENFAEDVMRQDATVWLKTRDYAQKAKAEGYDGVIFKNIHDNGGYSNGSEGASTVAIAFESNQIKSVANEKPTGDKDIRYSLSDTNGREVSHAVAKRFGNSKAVDENGNLKVLYHGTASGEFSIFDKAKGSVEGDFGSGFYFTDNEEDVSEHYEGGGPDFENKVARLAEQIESEEEIDYDEAEERARKQLYKGSHKFEVYLNIEKPAIVGETMLMDAESYLEQYNEEDYEDYDDYIGDVEQLVADDIENIVWEVEKNVDVYSLEGLADVLYNAYYEGGIGIEELKAKINDLYLEDSNGNLVGNEVTRQIIESLGYDGIIDPTVSGKWNMNIEEGTTHYIVFKPNQIKAVTNQNPTDNPDIHRSLSNVGDTAYGNRGTLGKDVAYVDPNAVAPIADNTDANTENVLPNTERVTPDDMAEMFPDEPTPQTELNNLLQEREALESRMTEMGKTGDLTDFESVNDRYVEVATRIAELENEISESESGRVNSLGDADVPPEMEAPMRIEDAYPGSKKPRVTDPFYDRNWDDAKNLTSIMEERPDLKPFFIEEAKNMLWDYADSQKAELIYNDQLHYDSGGEKGWMGHKRMTSEDIEEILDDWNISWDALEKGLNKIANGEAKTAVPKKLEFMLNRRLLYGYKDFHTGKRVDPNPAYIAALREYENLKHYEEERNSIFENADQYAPEDIAPVVKTATAPLAAATPDTMDAPIYQSKDPAAVKGQTSLFEPPKPNPSVATVLTKETQKAQEKSGIGKKLVSQLVDKGMVFENLSLETGNNEIQAKWDYALPSHTEARAQYFMENGANGVKPLKDIKKAVDKSGKADDFFNYLYHVHNIDRMTLDERFGVENKTVFGETVTADVSRQKVAKYEKANPEFKDWANDVYAYNRHLRQMLVDGNIISRETANLWEKMYPHYVPIRRVDSKGQNISVPLDTNKTGVSNPVKRAIGGSSDIQPVFATMAQRTEQTYRAIARNQFGIELKNTLGSTINSQENVTGVDEAVDTLVAQEDHLLKPGAFNSNPTFTVFENGERVEFEITEDMYDALKPAGKLLGHRIKAVNKIGDFRRNLLTVWNPVFALYRNPIKDIQDVAVNSQHPVRTYLNVPYAAIQLASDTKLVKAIFGKSVAGKYVTEYHQNGGKSNTYFDSRKNEFKAEDNIFKKTIGMPVRAVEEAGEFIEEIPRFAEYIASRQDGRSIERSMLDAGRVTTNFAAGGDFTKFLNSHGFTFLNASVQGASQHVRNFREAKQQGLKGYVKVLAKYTVAGLPGILLNSLMWDDDEDYEELSDYVKQNYYVVAKTEDGKFVRIPKGRTAAVMQNAMEQMQNLVTGNDEVDFQTFYELFMNNIAPNNPIENNIVAPLLQVKNNKAWYGGDLVPSRLQKLPAAEQFDESTDSISKWLSEKSKAFSDKTGLDVTISPYKLNYLLDQYSGGMGDVFLPMLTPEAESGDNSLEGNFLAPWKKEITTDKVLNNKNPGDFYDLRDELEVKSNSRNATEEDAMRTMYMDSVSWDMSDLYKQKREVQNSDLPDDEKYEEVRKIQEQINELAKNAMSGYNNVNIDGLYSEVGDRRYNKDVESGKWYEIHEKNSDGSDNWYYQKEQEVTKALGISYGEYWNNREEYNYAYDNPEKYTFSKAVGGYDSFRSYTSDLWDIKADKDENGKSINGSRKAKVIDYVNNLDADYGEKIILFKSEYNADDTYNQDIIDYLNSRDDIDYQEMETILKYLGFNVDSKGNITWD